MLKSDKEKLSQKQDRTKTSQSNHTEQNNNIKDETELEIQIPIEKKVEGLSYNFPPSSYLFPTRKAD